MKIHQAPIVKSLHTFYGDAFHPEPQDSIFSHLSRLASWMYEGIINNQDCVYTQINNYHQDYLGIPTHKLKEIDFDLPKCQHTIANEYSFSSWEEVKGLNKTKYNLDFEHAVNSIITGDLETLKSLIYRNPQLIQSNSQYGHGATLLHYTASNGVELWRQQVPINLPEITKFLIDQGTDKNATMRVYGSHFTTIQLLQTSAHPYEAGIAQSMIEILEL